MQRIVNSSLYLLSLQEVLQQEYASIPATDISALESTVNWAHSFLCKPHPQLGREGPVCPFTQPSIHKDLFWLSVYDQMPVTLNTASEAVMLFKQKFLALQSIHGDDSQYATILILFPSISNDDASSIVDTLQEQLKPEFVKEGLMIGQFHESCEEEGLWNSEFRPLQSPIPMLVIRNMVPSDFPFLKSCPEYIQAYLDNFAPKVPQRLRRWIAEVIEHETIAA